MDSTLKQEWITALRSGDYKQGKGGLKSTTNSFCCLGVLCDLLSKKGIGEWDKGFFKHSDNKNDAYFPPSILIKVKMPGQEKMFALANMNDCLTPFDRIADYIEETL